MARTMLDEHRTPRKYWAEAVNTACYVSNRIFLRAFMHKSSYELQFGCQPRVDHLRVFDCRCFVLKEGNLDKFESHSSDGIFLGYASYSRAYRVLIIDTNIVRETCEVTFDETASCNSSVFEIAGDDELGTPIFEDEEEEGAEGDVVATTRVVDPVASATSSDDDDGPDPTTSTSRRPVEQVTQPSPAAPKEALALVEEEVTSTREAPRHIQRHHPPQ